MSQRQLDGAYSTGELAVPLEELASPEALWPGRIGYVALDHLIDGSSLGPMALRTLCEEYAEVASVPAAFEAAFGTPLPEFYAEPHLAGADPRAVRG